MGPFGEKALIVSIVVFAFCASIGGVLIADHTGDPHWLNRTGALIVAVEGFLLFAELSRRGRLREIERRYGERNPYISIEALRAEKRLVVVVVTIIVLGELLHGFGDLVYETASEVRAIQKLLENL